MFKAARKSAYYYFFAPPVMTTSSLLEEIHEGWVNINSQRVTFGLKYSFGIFKNNIRINSIYMDGKFIENKYSAEIKFETA